MRIRFATGAHQRTASSVFVLGFTVVLAFLIAAQARADQNSHRITNGLLEIGFDPVQGRLDKILDSASKLNLVERDTALADLWELQCASAGGAYTISPAAAGRFSCEPVSAGESGVLLSWERFPAPAPEKLRVEVVARLVDRLPQTCLRIRVSSLGKASLREVRFPRVSSLTHQDNERLAVPDWLGQLTFEPRRALAGKAGQGARRAWSYPGHLSMQCMTYYAEPGAGLYVACDDAASFRKEFAFFGDSSARVGFELTHLPEESGEQVDNWELPYGVVLGVFEGDWFTAAERYRTWATNQAWAINSRLARSVVPAWVPQTALWVWNRGRSENVLGPAAALQKEAGLPVSVFWHWWHGCSYDTGFPEYLPPREGSEQFKQAISRAHEHGLHALVYMNQRLWGMTTRSWTEENAERFAVKGADGKIHPEMYNTFTRALCASMCLGTGFWRTKYAGLAERAVCDLGVDGIYMDQACSSLACYDPTHGHPLGGGTYWMDGFRMLAEDIRARCSKAPDDRLPKPTAPALAGEGCGESWLPYLDVMLSLQVSRERYAAPDGWEPIPFFTAVYHPYAITYGNYGSLTMPPYDELWPAEFAPVEALKFLDRKFSRQFYLEQARAFVWGQQPTIANFLPVHLRERTEEIKYVIRLARLRNRATKYLMHGIFLRPPKLNAPEAIVEISRLSIYAGQQGGLTTFQKNHALALASAWRAPDGDVGIAVASIADERLSLEVELDRQALHLPPHTQIWRLEEDERKLVGRLTQDESAIHVQLPPRGACLLELVRD